MGRTPRAAGRRLIGFAAASAFPLPFPLNVPFIEGGNLPIESPPPHPRGSFRLGRPDRYRPAGTLIKRNAKFLYNHTMRLILA